MRRDHGDHGAGAGLPGDPVLAVVGEEERKKAAVEEAAIAGEGWHSRGQGECHLEYSQEGRPTAAEIGLLPYGLINFKEKLFRLMNGERMRPGRVLVRYVHFYLHI